MIKSVKKNISSDKNYFKIMNNLMISLGVSDHKLLIYTLKSKGIDRQDLYNWKARKNISPEGIIEIHKKTGIPVNQIQKGIKKSESSQILDKTPEIDLSSSRPTRKIPVLGRIPAGFPDNIPQEQILEYIYCPNSPEGSFAVIVKGESMTPTINHGDYAIFLPNVPIESGDIIIVNNEWGESMLKRYREKDGEKYLLSDNPIHLPVKPNEHYRIMGKVVKVWREVKI